MTSKTQTQRVAKRWQRSLGAMFSWTTFLALACAVFNRPIRYVLAQWDWHNFMEPFWPWYWLFGFEWPFEGRADSGDLMDAGDHVASLLGFFLSLAIAGVVLSILLGLLLGPFVAVVRTPGEEEGDEGD